MHKRKLTDEACKNIIKSMGQRLGIDPKLITTRLMDENDKNDMREGNLSISVLELHVTLWIKAGCPDYAHGSTEPMENSPVLKNEKRSEPLTGVIVDRKRNRVLI